MKLNNDEFFDADLPGEESPDKPATWVDHLLAFVFMFWIVMGPVPGVFAVIEVYRQRPQLAKINEQQTLIIQYLEPMIVRDLEKAFLEENPDGKFEVIEVPASK